MRRRARKDANHGEIAKAFEKLGCTVLDLAQLGGGCPDLLVGIRGQNVLVEVKDGTKPPSATKLTEHQATFWECWKGAKTVVRSLDDVTLTARAFGWC